MIELQLLQQPQGWRTAGGPFQQSAKSKFWPPVSAVQHSAKTWSARQTLTPTSQWRLPGWLSSITFFISAFASIYPYFAHALTWICLSYGRMDPVLGSWSESHHCLAGAALSPSTSPTSLPGDTFAFKAFVCLFVFEVQLFVYLFVCFLVCLYFRVCFFVCSML